jgi:hypothetical protein
MNAVGQFASHSFRSNSSLKWKCALPAVLHIDVERKAVFRLKSLFQVFLDQGPVSLHSSSLNCQLLPYSEGDCFGFERISHLHSQWIRCGMNIWPSCHGRKQASPFSLVVTLMIILDSIFSSPKLTTLITQNHFCLRATCLACTSLFAIYLQLWGGIVAQTDQNDKRERREP